MAKGGTTRTGGEWVVRALERHGIDTVFCVPGESYLPVLDALHGARNRIRVVVCRHEHGAANMAEAWGKLTGRPGTCLVTRAPGACNGSIGVHTARQDSTPMLLLVGQVPRAHAGREAFQEVDLEAMFAPLAKWVGHADAAAALPELMAQACHAALDGRPGPAVLSLPEDVLAETAEADDAEPLAVAAGEPDPGAMERLHRILGDAERPLMVLGGGAWTDEARAHMVRFAEDNGLPVCCSFRRQDLFPNHHAHYAGELGLGPNPALLERVRDADLLLVVGARLTQVATRDYTLIAPPHPGHTLIHVHADEAELGRVYVPALGIAARPPAFAAAAAGLAGTGNAHRRPWVEAARHDCEADRMPPPCAGPLDPGAVMAELDVRLPADAVVTVDAGNFSGWPQRFLTFGGGRRLLGPTSGAMGYGTPAAVAAAIAAPERMVVGFVGDGGFGMTGQEVATAVQHGAAPLIIVFNNRMYGTIRMHQERRYPDRVVGTDLTAGDYAEVARGWGAHGERVDRTEDFAPALDRALAAGRAAVIELATDPEQVSTRATLTALRGTG